jgi:hypothetical protein
MEELRAPALPQPGEGQLTALGYLQIGTGCLTVLMSVLALAQMAYGPTELFNPARAFNYSADFFDRAIAAYVILQLTVGWIAGGLQLASGCCCLRGKRPRLVYAASLVSLINFPHGSVAALLMLSGLSRPEIARVFAGPPAAS